MSKAVITGKITNLEQKILDIQAQLKPTNKRLEIAYQYKDNLYDAMRQADATIKDIQNEVFTKTCQIQGILDEMKKELEIYCSHLY